MKLLRVMSSLFVLSVSSIIFQPSISHAVLAQAVGTSGGPYMATANPSATAGYLQGIFDTLPPSIGGYVAGVDAEAYVKLDADPQGQRLLTPNDSRCYMQASALMTRVGDPDGNIWIQIESVDGNNRTSPALCTSETVNAEQPNNGEPSEVIFPFSTPCCPGANTNVHFVIENDTDYDNSYNATNTYVAIWNGAGNRYPCTDAWTNGVSPSTFTGGCDREEINGGSWSVTANEDLIIALGTPSAVVINPGPFVGQTATRQFAAFLTVTGFGEDATFWTPGQSGSQYFALNLAKSYMVEVANLTFSSTLDEEDEFASNDSTMLSLQTVVAPYAHDLRIQGGDIGFYMADVIDGLIEDVQVDAYCVGIAMAANHGPSTTTIRDAKVRISGISPVCSYMSSFNAISGIFLKGDNAITDSEVTISDTRVDVNVYSDLAAYGIFVGSNFDSNLVLKDVFSKANYLGPETDQSAISLNVASDGTTDTYNSTFISTNTNSATGYSVGVFNNSATGTINVYGGRMNATAGGGTVVDIGVGGNGPTTNVRGTIWNPSTYAALSGTPTFTASPTFGTATAATPSTTSTAVTTNGVSTSHICTCKSNTGGCIITDSKATAAHTCTAYHANDTTCDGAAIVCDARIMP